MKANEPIRNSHILPGKLKKEKLVLTINKLIIKKNINNIKKNIFLLLKYLKIKTKMKGKKK